MTITRSITAAALLSLTLPSVFARPKLSTHQSPSASWHGWPEVRHIFSFGDSYTNTHFNLSGPRPSRENPLGNPDYPGETSSNGPNWIDFLTTTYNETLVQTVNLAYSGAVVDAALVTPYLETVQTLKNQVEDEYLPTYAQHPSFFDWKPETTLFAIWIGINDVNLAYNRANSTLTFKLIFDEYTALAEKLYESGARNYLLLNLPPVDRCPMTVATGPAAQQLQKTTIEAWNRSLRALETHLKATHPDVTTFFIDTNKIFRGVISDPCSYPSTCAYKNTIWYCDACEF